eukprot:1134598-Pyramimonas_sp.AAC.1
MWDCQRTVRVSLLGSDDSYGPGFRCVSTLCWHASPSTMYTHSLCRSGVPGKQYNTDSPVGSREFPSRHGSRSVGFEKSTFSGVEVKGAA